MTASCLCGAVRLELGDELRDVVVCHCSLCRRAGTLAGAYTSVPREALRVEQGEVRWFTDENGRRRGFCAGCGSIMAWDAGGDTVSVSAGALDGDAGLRVARHVFTGSAAPWEHVPGDAPHRDA